MISKKLQMEFLTENDRKFTISLDNPREDIDLEELTGVMDTIVQEGIFKSQDFLLKTGLEGRIVTTSVEKIE